MRKWSERSKEVAYLLNPAFCGRIIYNTIKKYGDVTHRTFPFPLIYLILPLILHKHTRELINSKTKMLIWLQRYPETIINFAKRTKDLIPITNEAIELLMQAKKIRLTNNGELEVVMTSKSLSKTKFTNIEIKECINKSEHIAKWFAEVGKTETIYISLGVRP
ncbi:three component ABC system middle component [Clostridium butyricum]|uniref:three component ABC system middle component n=1 Tax=Clostridium butyricum TaxID=1492 RepID=UPI00374F1ABA